jgi:hypothetical protein
MAHERIVARWSDSAFVGERKEMKSSRACRHWESILSSFSWFEPIGGVALASGVLDMLATGNGKRGFPRQILRNRDAFCVLYGHPRAGDKV